MKIKILKLVEIIYVIQKKKKIWEKNFLLKQIYILFKLHKFFLFVLITVQFSF